MSGDDERIKPDRDGRVLTAEEARDGTPTEVPIETWPAPVRPVRDTPASRRQGGGMSATGWLLSFLALAAAILIGLVLWAVLGEEEIPRTGATVDSITTNPSLFHGDLVVVAGEVERVLGRHAFTIGGDDFLGGDELLVVSPDPLPTVAGRPGATALAEDDVVQASGPVRYFALADVERDLGIDLEDGLFAAWEGQPAVVARRLDLTPRADGFDHGAGATIEEIAEDPARYIGRRVTVSGEIDDLLGPRAFTIGGEGWFDGDELLVVSAGPIPAPRGRPADAPLREDDLVQVTGPVRRFALADVEREIGVDLDDARFANWEGQPAVVATRVAPTPRTTPANLAEPAVIPNLLENQAAFHGERVTVSARVTQLIGPNAFVLDHKLLVVARDLPDDLQDDEVVQVTGTFSRFDREWVERELGLPVQGRGFEEFKDGPVIVADTITPIRFR